MVRINNLIFVTVSGTVTNYVYPDAGFAKCEYLLSIIIAKYIN